MSARTRPGAVVRRPVRARHRHEAHPSVRSRAKRLLDVTAGLVLIPLLAPVWVMVAVLVWAEDRGPVLFHHTRVGLNGRPFGMWKFRTMHTGAEARLGDLLSRQQREPEPLFKIADDPRVTRVGRLLRRSSLDELPQLLNVLAGTMSLVGPRPQVAAEVALYDAQAARRLSVRPGMTGLWQVCGRSGTTWQEARSLDLQYVDTWSLGLDLRILARTLPAVLRGDGAQ